MVFNAFGRLMHRIGRPAVHVFYGASDTCLWSGWKSAANTGMARS